MKIKKTSHRFRATLAICLLSVFSGTGLVRAADLSENDQQFLAKYEKVRAALAADDLPATKAAAADLGEEARPVAAAETIKTARTEFEKLSDRAVAMAKGHEGYYVAYCPMVRKSWVQTAKEISNPYAGQEMLTCGVIKK